MTGGEIFENPAARASSPGLPGLPGQPDRGPLAFHRKLPGYSPAPLTEVPGPARQLGAARVWVKDESSRLTLPSFKMLGASWASYRALAQRLGTEPPEWTDVAELRQIMARLRPITLAAATDGNHGRAVARMAAWLGFGARIFVPRGTADARIAAIEGEGASVTVVDGTYDDAVARSALEAGERCVIVSDTSWPGYEQTPRWVIEGYSTIFWEIEDQLAAAGERGPDLVVVPVGVGALAAASIRHYRRHGEPGTTAAAGAAAPRLAGVEPLTAACVLASLRAGAITSVPGPHESIMAGLNCGRPSYVAWPYLSRGLDLVIAITDARARQAMRALAACQIVSGESGAAALGGLMELADAGGASRLGVAGARVLVLSTEGATDPRSYRDALESGS